MVVDREDRQVDRLLERVGIIAADHLRGLSRREIEDDRCAHVRGRGAFTRGGQRHEDQRQGIGRIRQAEGNPLRVTEIESVIRIDLKRIGEHEGDRWFAD